MENRTKSKFLVIYQDLNYDIPFTPELSDELTKKHVEHCRDLDSRGILFLCGPVMGEEKGMFILSAESLEEAEDCVNRDPFIINKCYKSYVINEIEEANAGNNYLLEKYLSGE
ncbi:YciI family protein [Breznakiella homolactica]|uniref:YCII-related domain-containing protein n=1 Tax=Breznakiella homolactica TaxID=2798577 RepID=A0A7T7XJZ4_9SPIR|nr:YciI family protein [Breznakiella homolactica]QQO07632.1 YciI family protein [Breznakiella homolactica]